ncbi:helix-turn-helix domain-containing protein [Herbidospora cretacea]|uniref:helix-turn-helix domain-containing protein n=1 Tax=Herbidospora cretacea TaxID=28444 RepID=UPI000B25C394|nr:helix-turn-helix domain-containing protein [Herbidospora cretacea]
MRGSSAENSSPEQPDALLADVAKAETSADLGLALQKLQARAGVSARQLDKQTRHEETRLSASTVSDVLRGKRLPKKATFMALVAALSGSDRDSSIWAAAYDRASYNGIARRRTASAPDELAELRLLVNRLQQTVAAQQVAIEQGARGSSPHEAARSRTSSSHASERLRRQVEDLIPQTARRVVAEVAAEIIHEAVIEMSLRRRIDEAIPTAIREAVRNRVAEMLDDPRLQLKIRHELDMATAQAAREVVRAEARDLMA